MSASVTVLTAGHLPAIRRFADRHIRPEYPVFEERFFQWQFHQRSDDGTDPSQAALGTVAETGEVLSLSLGRAEPAWVAGRIETGGWLHEWFADPSHQGGGFVALSRMLKQTGLMAASGHALTTTNIWSRLRLMVEFELERLFAVCDADATMGLLLASGEMTGPYLRLCRPAPAPEVTCHPVVAFDDAYETCWRRMREGVTVAIDRSAGFMNWRYLRHPVFRYEARRAETNHGAAYFVWRIEAVAGRPATVARLVEAIGAPHAIADAFPTIFTEIGKTGAAFVDYFGTNANVLAGLCGGGMRRVVNTPDFDLPRLFSPLAADCRRKLKFAFSPRPDALDPVSRNDVGRTYFTKGDGNQDRPNRLDHA